MRGSRQAGIAGFASAINSLHRRPEPNRDLYLIASMTYVVEANEILEGTRSPSREQRVSPMPVPADSLSETLLVVTARHLE